MAISEAVRCHRSGRHRRSWNLKRLLPPPIRAGTWAYWLSRTPVTHGRAFADDLDRAATSRASVACAGEGRPVGPSGIPPSRLAAVRTPRWTYAGGSAPRSLPHNEIVVLVVGAPFGSLRTLGHDVLGPSLRFRHRGRRRARYGPRRCAQDLVTNGDDRSDQSQSVSWFASCP
jgi:hypothetical protein